MATKNARDAAPDATQPVSQRNGVALVEARRMIPDNTSDTQSDGFAQELANWVVLTGIGATYAQL